MNAKKRQSSIVDLLRAYHRLDQMEKSLRSRSLQSINTTHPKEESKKRRFVGPDYVPPKTRDCPRNNLLITSFLQKTTHVETNFIGTMIKTDDNYLQTINETKREGSDTSQIEELVKRMSQVNIQVSEKSKPANDFTYLMDDLKTPDSIVRKRNYNQMISDNCCTILTPSHSFFKSSLKRNKTFESEEHDISISNKKSKKNDDNSDSESVVTMCRHIVEELERVKHAQHGSTKLNEK